MTSSLKWAQCGQVGAAYSMIVIGALGEPSVRSSAAIVKPGAPVAASGTASAVLLLTALTR